MPLTPEEVYPVAAGAMPYALIDVRAPVEVARGALPGAHELPLMVDTERHLVGLRYRDAGQEAAIALGYELAGPHLPARIAAWRAVADAGPTAVTCWRGGLRSALAVRHLDRAGVQAVTGGYKALRAHLAAGLADAVRTRPMVVLGGLTGAGKTDLLARLAADATRSTAGRSDTDRAHDVLALDLEGHAQHRGSAFGAVEAPQPAQATFENAVAAEVVLSPAGRIAVEDESRYVGRRTVPDTLWAAMRAAPVVWLEAGRTERLARVFEAYVRDPTLRLGAEAARVRLEADVAKVRRRLGAQRTDAVLGTLRAADADWLDPDAHAPWIGVLLDTYYDRLYLSAFERSGRTVFFRGDADEVEAFLRTAA